MKRLMIWLVSAALMSGSAVALSAQNSGAKEDAKEAGRATEHAVKKTGSAIKKGTKKVVHAGAKKTRQGAKKVEEKTDK